jgi:lipopolysaccharide transport system ATP-binding protein
MGQIIQIHHVSKKYRLMHDAFRHMTLIETLSRKASTALNKVLHPFRKMEQFSTEEEFWALKDIHLTIEEGDRVGIIGKNGAGKSTLLKILSRITGPTEGWIKMHGRVVSLLEVGTGFHPELTGKENIYLNGAILGMKKQEIRRKFDEIVAFAEVEKFIDTPVKRYSSGMFNRLGFAIAAHLDPDLLIADEVLGVGDLRFQQKCLKKLNDLGSHGRTVLFVSHDMGSVMSLCNKGIYLEQGKTKVFGPIDQCISSYMKEWGTKSLEWNGLQGDEHIQITKVSLDLSHERDFYYQGEKATVNVEYTITKPNPDIVMAVYVFNERIQLLAGSHTGDAGSEFSAFSHVGQYMISFDIDVGLFHEGEYTLELDCVIHNRKKLLKEDIQLKYQVYTPKKDIRFTANRAGVFLGNRWSFQECQ